MLATEKKVISQSRTYVAVCNNGNFDGHYFKKFTIPDKLEGVPAHAQNFAACHDLKNDADFATWYFLNVLNYSACIDGCFTFEDFSNLTEQKVQI